MKVLTYVFIVLAIIALAFSSIIKFSTLIMIAGIGSDGYLTGTIILLLLAANFALLELLAKK